jgi:hypothetical protein
VSVRRCSSCRISTARASRAEACAAASASCASTCQPARARGHMCAGCQHALCSPCHATSNACRARAWVLPVGLCAAQAPCSPCAGTAAQSLSTPASLQQGRYPGGPMRLLPRPAAAQPPTAAPAPMLPARRHAPADMQPARQPQCGRVVCTRRRKRPALRTHASHLGQAGHSLSTLWRMQPGGGSGCTAGRAAAPSSRTETVWQRGRRCTRQQHTGGRRHARLYSCGSASMLSPQHTPTTRRHACCHSPTPTSLPAGCSSPPGML